MNDSVDPQKFLETRYWISFLLLPTLSDSHSILYKKKSFTVFLKIKLHIYNIKVIIVRVNIVIFYLI